MKRPNIKDYKHIPELGSTYVSANGSEYDEDIEKYIDYLESRIKLKNNGDLGDVSGSLGGIIIPRNKSEKNIILTRAMTYLSEDAEECGMAKQVFDELASLMDE